MHRYFPLGVAANRSLERSEELQPALVRKHVQDGEVVRIAREERMVGDQGSPAQESDARGLVERDLHLLIRPTGSMGFA